MTEEEYDKFILGLRRTVRLRRIQYDAAKKERLQCEALLAEALAEEHNCNEALIEAEVRLQMELDASFMNGPKHYET